MIFIDGLGIGEDDHRDNPLARYPDIWPRKGCPPDRHDLGYTALDACLSVEGLPQSATGQTSLLTGENAARLLGKHLQGFPSRRLVEILKQKSIFIQLKRYGLKVTFANAYRHPEDVRSTSRLSVTSHALRACGEAFRSIEQLPRGQALYHDFTNRSLRDRGYDAPLFTPEQAGDILIRIARQHDFTLYEHFLTDVVAHQGDGEAITRQVDELYRFVKTVLDRINPMDMMVIITSDHGNIEDLSVKTHTLNPVPLLWLGPSYLEVQPLPKDITGVTPWVLRLLKCRG